MTSPRTLLVRDAGVNGRRVDIRVGTQRILEVGAALTRRSGEAVIDAAGGAVLPGLHDHHLHLMAMAAARTSVNCHAGLEVLRTAEGSGWIRGVGARVDVDRHHLDRIVADRPVRVQHHSGGLWMLNSVALELVRDALDDSIDVERDADGKPTGRLRRYDARLRAALPTATVDLRAVTDDLIRYGITSVTDATPNLDDEAIGMLSELPLPVTALGDPRGRAPWKLLLRDHDLPNYDELRAMVSRAREQARGVAVHCVTRESLLLTLAVLDEVGHHPDDRIEHAAVVPDAQMVSGMRVVTQPAFVTTRREKYLHEVDLDDQPYLYPFAELLASGAEVWASSDAPFGPLDPWEIMRAARDRDLNPAQRVPVRTVLDSYLRDPYGRRRLVAAGRPPHLLLLHTPLAVALDHPDASLVRQVITPTVTEPIATEW